MNLMNKILNLFLVLVFACNFSNAQDLGARVTAMGMNGAAVKDLWSLDANPSGITELKSTTVGINYAQFLIDSEISRQAIAVVIPTDRNYYGASLQRYGISAYNEIKIGFVMAKKFGNKLAIALKGNYHQLKISNYGATTGFSIDVGSSYRFNEEIVFGLALNNPFLQAYNTQVIASKIPTIIQIGLSYQTSDKLLIATTIKKELRNKVDVSLGLEYNMLRLLSLRAGLTAKPFKQYAGFGLRHKKLMLDLAATNDTQLGFTPQIGLAYAF